MGDDERRRQRARQAEDYEEGTADETDREEGFGYADWEVAYLEGDDGSISETYLLDPDEGFTEEDLLFAENAFSPSMMGSPSPKDGLEEPDIEMEERETDAPSTDPKEVIDGGRIYYPPEDPPTLPSADFRDVDVAGGFATGADDAPPGDQDLPDRFVDSDDDIAQRIQEALRLHSYTAGMRIKVQVVDGVATLRGRVDSLTDVGVIEDIASEIEGVEEVREQLTVG